MAQAQDDRLTAEHLYDLPDEDGRFELVRGRLVEEPPPTFSHGRIAARIAYLLASYLDDHPVGEVATCDPGFILARDPDTVRGPDVALLLHERYPEDETEDKYMTGAPNLAVEVLSKSDRPGAVAAKVEDYLRAGATCVWIVDPRRQTVQVHRPGAAPLTLSGAQAVAAPELLPDFNVAAAQFFRFSRGE